MSSKNEIEIKYLLPLGEITASICLDELPLQKLTQSYFSRKYIREKLIPLIKQLKPQMHIPGGCEYKNGRVREVHEGSSSKYYLTLKGPRDGGYSRLEIEFEIDKNLYAELAQESDRGSVGKNKYFAEGRLNRGDSEVAVTAEIDLVTLAAGKTISVEDLPFVIVEIELDGHRQVEDVRRGRHSFSFLESAIEINMLDRKVQKYFRMRDLARYGITPAVAAAAADLFKLTEK